MINIKKSLIGSLIVSAAVSAVVTLPTPSHAASAKDMVPSYTTTQNVQGQATANSTIEKVIQTGMKYLGTPYEFGSNRNTTTTFDCSDFIRQIFKESAGVVLPTDSRQQGTWIKQNSTPVYSIDKLKRGDLVFFMSYKGSSSSAYSRIDKSQERITHVALYLGDGKLLHTYSQKAGGVVVTDFSSSWQNRFLYGGSVLK
ncbi:C40 family peptidase [Paenibacillus motobuensis]|uniref:NlpC/P60 domain-containing protein n=1 Tax=Paenibacillus motobuensis TaxID=295324 RepID=A0ABN0Y2M6_9BACL